jgi:hypothetical protein
MPEWFSGSSSIHHRRVGCGRPQDFEIKATAADLFGADSARSLLSRDRLVGSPIWTQCDRQEHRGDRQCYSGLSPGPSIPQEKL